jgi:hypothetical protein
MGVAPGERQLPDLLADDGSADSDSDVLVRLSDLEYKGNRSHHQDSISISYKTFCLKPLALTVTV